MLLLLATLDSSGDVTSGGAVAVGVEGCAGDAESSLGCALAVEMAGRLGLEALGWTVWVGVLYRLVGSSCEWQCGQRVERIGHVCVT